MCTFLIFYLILIFSNFIVDTLKCYAPKLEWSRNNEPIFRNNNFEIVRCNTGLQKCFGGCKHCMSVEGPLEVKSCAGDTDINLQILGLDADGCKNLTKIESEKYAQWISDSVFQGKQAVNAKFTRVCRCSWNGCNGLSGLELHRRQKLLARKNVPVGGGTRSRHKYYTTTPYQLFIYTFLVKRFVLLD